MSETFAPLGAEAVESSAPVDNNQSTTSDSNLSTSPSGPVDLSDDTPVRWPGEKEPIRYGDLAKRLQADYTKKTQSFSREQQTFQQQMNQARAEIAAERARLEQLAASLLQRQNGQPQDEFLNQLTGKPYIDGQTAAALYKELKENGLGQVFQEIQKRDQVSQMLYGEVMSLRKELQSLRGNHVNQQFEGKINRWLTDGGYPPEAAELAKEIYLAYEGDDLDAEFPTIFQNRWNQLQNIFRSQQQQKVEAAKKRPFSFPGKGGNGTPGKTIGLKGNESPREAADFLWDALQASDQT